MVVHAHQHRSQSFITESRSSLYYTYATRACFDGAFNMGSRARELAPRTHFSWACISVYLGGWWLVGGRGRLWVMWQMCVWCGMWNAPLTVRNNAFNAHVRRYAGHLISSVQIEYNSVRLSRNGGIAQAINIQLIVINYKRSKHITT